MAIVHRAFIQNKKIIINVWKVFGSPSLLNSEIRNGGYQIYVYLYG